MNGSPRCGAFMPVRPWVGQQMLWKLALLAGLALVASGCAGSTGASARIGGDYGPSAANYKVGQPYEIRGVTYTPVEDPYYDEEGIASWYGEPFHGRRTANGEVYDMNELTAAHKTLPMPVYVRVTNLENRRTLVLRVNDRGPFVAGRIIDVSRRAAQLLDFHEQGVVRVRVQVIDPETQKTYAELHGKPAGTAVATASAERNASSIQLTSVSAAVGGHFVQAAAFADHDNAFAVSQSLAGLGDVQVYRAVVDGRVYYRVRLGPYTNEERAGAVQRDVAARGYPDAFLVVAH